MQDTQKGDISLKPRSVMPPVPPLCSRRILHPHIMSPACQKVQDPLMLIREWGSGCFEPGRNFVMLTVSGQRFVFGIPKLAVGYIVCIVLNESLFSTSVLSLFCHFLSSDPASSQLDCFVAMPGRGENETGTEVKVKKCGPHQWSLLCLYRNKAAFDAQAQRGQWCFLQMCPHVEYHTCTPNYYCTLS